MINHPKTMEEAFKALQDVFPLLSPRLDSITLDSDRNGWSIRLSSPAGRGTDEMKRLLRLREVEKGSWHSELHNYLRFIGHRDLVVIHLSQHTPRLRPTSSTSFRA